MPRPTGGARISYNRETCISNSMYFPSRIAVFLSSPLPVFAIPRTFFFFKITSVDSFLSFSFFFSCSFVRSFFFLIVRRTGEKRGGEKKEGRKSADMNIHKFKFTPRVTTQSDVIYIALASSLPYTSSPPAKLFNR